MPNTTKPLVGHAALRRHRVSLPGHVYHITTTTRERRRYFDDFLSARAAVRALNSHEALGGSEPLAWVLMPDHLHMLVQLAEHAELPALMNRLKAATARSVNRQLGRSGPVWQQSFHDHLLRKEEDLKAVARYIVMNPLRAGLVKRISEYPHWDAAWL